MLILKRIFESENSRNTHGRISLYKLHSTSGGMQGILHKWPMIMTCMETPRTGCGGVRSVVGVVLPPVVGVGGVSVEQCNRRGRSRRTSRGSTANESNTFQPTIITFSCRWNLQCWTWEATKKTIRRLTKGDFGPQLLWSATSTRISPTHHPQCSGHQGFHMWSYKLNQKI